ncbi:MAG TPA: hypothetical protein VF707_00460 [Ardenticatenaceae bacterium]|jgi:hypothetical protein
MSSSAWDSQQADQQLHRLLSEKLAGDHDAVRRVEALIHELSVALRADSWEFAPPANINNGRIPHC